MDPPECNQFTSFVHRQLILMQNAALPQYCRTLHVGRCFTEKSSAVPIVHGNSDSAVVKL
jgi:hypothetical protein